LLKTPHHERSNEEHHEGKVLTFLKACKAGEKTINTQSHDDSDCRSHECTLYQSASHAPDEESRFRDLRNYYSWQVLSPSHGYLIHMDMTQPESWYPRLEQGQCPVQWDLLNENKNHQGSSECLKDLNFLYREHAAFWKLGPQGYKPLYDSQDQAVVSYLRTDEKEDHLIIVHNFKNSGYSEYELPIHNLILKVSRVMEIFNSDRATYHGSGKFENKPIEIIIEENQKTRLRLALPPLSSLVLQIVS
jgi:1,4-alpha-glucan branching enzyme